MGRIVLLICFVLCSAASFAQTLFEENTILESVYSAPYTDADEVDINNDGIKDIFASNQIGMVYYLGNGTAYDYPKDVGRYTELFYNLDYSLADIDLDGDIDAVSSIVEYEFPIINLHKFNATTNSYDEPVFLELPVGELGGILFHDLDADGFVDIIYSSGSAGTYGLYWMRNNGAADFEAPVLLYESAELLLYIKMADYDLDGDSELFGVLRGGGIGFLDNTGAPDYYSTYFQIAPPSDFYGPFELSDFDADSYPDLIGYADGVNASERELFYHRNLSGADWGVQLTIDSLNDRRLRTMTVEDIDQDGYMDILMSGGLGDSLLWFRYEESSGGFSSRIPFGDDYYNQTAYVFLVRANDSGSFQDLLAFPTDKIYNYDLASENLVGNGFFDIPLGNWYYTDVQYIDLDNDGDLDMLPSRAAATPYVVIYENDGLGNFPEYGNILTDYNVNRPVRAPLYGALNGDDLIDIFYLRDDDDGFMNSTVAYIQNLGDLNLSTPQELDLTAVLDDVYDLFVHDMDNDGDVDLFVNNVHSSTAVDPVWYYVENIDSFTGPITPVLVCDNCEGDEMKFADLDNDGFDDLIFGHEQQVVWIKNNGDGSFEPQEILAETIGGLIRQLEVGDLSGDGNTDIVYSQWSTENIYWLQNTDGTTEGFSLEEIPQGYTGRRYLKILDVNLDGLNDIVSIRSAAMVWYENLGDSSFSLAQAIATGDSEELWPLHVTVANIDEFSPPEIIITSIEDPALYRNQNIRTYSYFGFDYNEIQGKVAFDYNADGCDSGDPNIPDVLIRSEYSSGSQTVISSDLGYIMSVPSEDVTTAIAGGLPEFMTATPDEYSYTFGGGEFVNADFCAVTDLILDDLSIDFIPTSGLRPGRMASYLLRVSNNGTTAQDASVSLNYAAADLSLVSSSVAPTLDTPGMLEFEFPSLLPFQSVSIRLRFQAEEPPEVVLGDVLEFSGDVIGTESDATPENNSFEFFQEATDSYDPNDIQVLEGPEVHIDNAGDYLNYIIRFQNLGNAEAIDVSVENAIDPNLDWTTFKLMGMSHSGAVTIENDNLLHFEFDNINLPYAEADEPGSNGYIAYRIKPKADVELGDVISNVADIFFDFNPAITTNTVTTTFVQDQAGPMGNTDAVRLFPNPSMGVVNLRGPDLIVQLQLFNQLGQVVWQLSDMEGITVADISSLAPGIYFAETVDRSGDRRIVKLIRQ